MSQNPPYPRRWSRRRLLVLDACVVGLYGLVVLGPASVEAVEGMPRWIRWPLYAALLVPLLFRRVRPLLVLGVVAAVTTLASVLRVAPDTFFALAFAIYPVATTWAGASRFPTYLPGAVGAAVLAGTALSGPLGSWNSPLIGVVLGLCMVGISWTLGRVVSERRQLVAAHAARLAERAVAEERLRIARELHDVVAHSLSVVTVKASVASHVATVRPEEVPDALRVIESTSREALTEVRQLLGVLRSDRSYDAEAGPEPSVAAPAPRIDELPALVAHAGHAGVRLELRTHGLDDLPDGVGLSVYRIVQEAITNVVRHAAPASGQVRVEADGREVWIEVNDDGPGERGLATEHVEDQPGHGLIGMRERVMMYGGSVSAGAREEGGFVVTCRLPYHAERHGPGTGEHR